MFSRLRPWLALVAVAAALAGFVALTVAWRLPVAVNALVRYPALTAVQAASLITAGCGLWLELVESPPFLPVVGRPLRAAFAALPMWVIWANAYIMAFTRMTAVVLVMSALHYVGQPGERLGQ